VRVILTGATGLLGSALIEALVERGDEVGVLSRDPERARGRLPSAAAEAAIHRWDPRDEPAPAEALAGADVVMHLAGENIAQRWSRGAKARIRESRVLGTRNLVEGLRALREQEPGALPGTLLSASAIGYYGARGEEPLDEDGPRGEGFLAEVCEAWEREAARAAELGMRVVRLRTGVVLDPRGGALAKMLPPFRLGIGGPVAGGRQYVSWIHREDLVGVALAAILDERWSGPVNATAPAPARNSELASALGGALHRPAVLPVPAVALRLLYGQMASLITTGARVVPAKALVLGYRFAHPELQEALRSVLAAPGGAEGSGADPAAGVSRTPDAPPAP
jgi:uncharacterized protein (TIGR01777 family)